MKMNLLKVERCPVCHQRTSFSVFELIQAISALYVMALFFLVIPTMLILENKYVATLAFYGVFTCLYVLLTLVVVIFNKLKKSYNAQNQATDFER